MENATDPRLIDRSLVVDVHCHVSVRGCRATLEPRFSFEQGGCGLDADGTAYDGYLSPRLRRRIGTILLPPLMGISRRLPDDAFDRAVLDKTYEHVSQSPSVDRAVLLAFDEYYAAEGARRGPAVSRREYASDLYVSNTLVHHLARRHVLLLDDFGDQVG